MSSAISDTGPILHLSEIGRLNCLGVFDEMFVPDLVISECEALGVMVADSSLFPLAVSFRAIPESEWRPFAGTSRTGYLHPADAEVFALARQMEFRLITLTDDLVLRRRIEAEGGTVAGTVGILVRALQAGLLGRAELSLAIDSLFTTSTLHMSRPFRTYVRRLISDILK